MIIRSMRRFDLSLSRIHHINSCVYFCGRCGRDVMPPIWVLGNVETDAEGKTVISMEDSVAKLIGPHSIIGRSVIIHVGEDDLGKVIDPL